MPGLIIWNTVLLNSSRNTGASQRIPGLTSIQKLCIFAPTPTPTQLEHSLATPKTRLSKDTIYILILFFRTCFQFSLSIGIFLEIIENKMFWKCLQNFSKFLSKCHDFWKRPHQVVERWTRLQTLLKSLWRYSMYHIIYELRNETSVTNTKLSLS